MSPWFLDERCRESIILQCLNFLFLNFQRLISGHLIFAIKSSSNANSQSTTTTIDEQQQDSIVDQNMDFESIMNFMDDSESDDDDLMKNDTTGEEEEKRAITYEMEKNKGLTPKRKREQRNPRVKYRKKYEKAVIRRKGQVRLPRKELQKYGGEMTGINVRSVKSVKFK